MTAFLGFNIATSGLFTARTALDVTAHNISNANTIGYSRQIVEQRATRALPGAGKGMIGTGSEIYGINQMRDFYLDTKYWSENSILGQYSVKKTQLSLMESLFNEPSDSGFNAIFNSFFDAINGVVNNADSGEHRAALKEAAVTFTQYFNTTAQHLKKYQRDLNFEIKTKVEEINVIARKIQDLNQQIYKYEMDGSKANDLRDERAKLVDQLSKIVNVEVEEIEVNPEVKNGNLSGVDYRDKSEKHFRVKINGQILVDHFNATELRVVPRETPNNPEDVEGLYDIQWANGLKFDITDPNLSGELKGYIDMRDGNGTIYKGIPYYLNRLNEFVRTFARAVNEGLDRNGDPIPELGGGHLNAINSEGEKGYYFFTYVENGEVKGKEDLGGTLDYSKITAENFSLSKDILEDPGNIAAAFDDESLPSGNGFMEAFKALRNYTHLFREGTADSYMNSIISELGINAKQANMMEATQTNITMAVENQRMSVSGVDINEEMTHMIQFQQLYNAAAKMISVMDQILDVTINRMGV